MVMRKNPAASSADLTGLDWEADFPANLREHTRCERNP